MRRRRGAALLLVLVVLLVATGASALALRWATLQLQLGRGWRRAVDAEAAVHSSAARVLQSGRAVQGTASWLLADSLVLVRVGGGLAGPGMEIVGRPPAEAEADSTEWRPLGVRGLLPLH